jgi:hypothetical protein
MAVVKREKMDLRDVSKTGGTCTREIHDDGSRTVNELYEVISAGSLQRIATALENISISLGSINNKMDHPLGTYDLQKQVGKLRARLRAAGLDDNPYTDNRGRPKSKK